MTYDDHARSIEDRRWAAVLRHMDAKSDPIVTTPAFISTGGVDSIGGHAFLTTLELAVTITEAPRSEERPLVNVAPLLEFTGVGLDARQRLVVLRGGEAMTLDLYPSEFSRELLIGLRASWERATGEVVTGDWSHWEASVLCTPAWREAGA